MKNILIILFALIGFSAFAQKGSAVKLPLAIGDTLVNTGTVAKYITITGGYSGSSIQVILTKLSGTGAGTVKYYGSNDGVNYNNIATADTTITNVATQSHMIYIASPLPTKLKILCTGAGTESVKVAVWYRLPVYQNN